MKPSTLYCPVCGAPCGKYYPDTHEEPGFCEGRGEDFIGPDGSWHCSQYCLDTRLSWLTPQSQDAEQEQA